MGARATPVTLALQGGGSHGAFGWGVLDVLLGDPQLDVRVITAASAGAMNAAAALGGLAANGPDGARAALAGYWEGLSSTGAGLSSQVSGVWDAWMKGMAPAVATGATYAMLDALTRLTSPYDRNPLNINPLRDVVERQIDFEAVHRSPITLHVSATNVRTGRARIFTNPEISVDVLLASACLPFLFHAVEIEGEAYWDGGYVGNPALSPVIAADAPRDVIIVHLSALARPAAPFTADEIMERMNEVSFNGALLGELRMLARAQAEAPKPGWFRRRRGVLAEMRVHEIRADDAFADLPPSSKAKMDRRFLHDLRDRGREAATAWLADCADLIGRRSTIDLAGEYLTEGR